MSTSVLVINSTQNPVASISLSQSNSFIQRKNRVNTASNLSKLLYGLPCSGKFETLMYVVANNCSRSNQFHVVLKCNFKSSNYIEKFIWAASIANQQKIQIKFNKLRVYFILFFAVLSSTFKWKSSSCPRMFSNKNIVQIKYISHGTKQDQMTILELCFQYP